MRGIAWIVPGHKPLRFACAMGDGARNTEQWSAEDPTPGGHRRERSRAAPPGKTKENGLSLVVAGVPQENHPAAYLTGNGLERFVARLPCRPLDAAGRINRDRLHDHGIQSQIAARCGGRARRPA